MVSYDTECVFAIVRILKCTIPLQILIFLYFLSVLLIFVRSSYTAFRLEPLDAARRAGRLAGMRKESPARSHLPPDYAAAPVCLPSCSPLSLKLCGETGELVCRFPGSGFLPDGNSISAPWHARVIDGHGLLPRKRNAPAVIQFCGRSFALDFNFHKNDSKR